MEDFRSVLQNRVEINLFVSDLVVFPSALVKGVSACLVILTLRVEDRGEKGDDEDETHDGQHEGQLDVRRQRTILRS